jgi:4-amino-4-deoxy-L-arabinose transferase-like glycosyltransferase
MSEVMFRELEDDQARKWSRWLLAGLFIIRLLYLFPFTSAFDLASDESYYWDWGRRPDWGYYSKPPMIGWLMGLIGWLSGNSEFAIRLTALSFGTASLALIHALARRMFDERTALLALLMVALTPASMGLSLLLTIDAPLVLCWSAALLLFWRAQEAPTSIVRWLLLLLVLGLGNLSKQMMLVFPLLMVVFCITTAEGRKLLRQWRMWLCIGGSLLFMLPVLIWNQQHGWITLKHMSEHVRPTELTNVVAHLLDIVLFPLLQSVVLSPLTWLITTVALVGAAKRWRTLNAGERYLTLFSAPALAVFYLMTLRQSINPNWPAVFYLSGTVLAAAWLRKTALADLSVPRIQSLARPAIIVGLVFTAASYSLPLLVSPLGLAGAKIDPMVRLRGWREVGQAAEKFLAAVPDPAHTFIVGMGHRELASALAFYMPSHPITYRYEPTGDISSQYELWPGPPEEIDDALFIVPTEMEITPFLTHSFRLFKQLGEINVELGNGRLRKYQVHLGLGVKRWPEGGSNLMKEVERYQAELEKAKEAESSNPASDAGKP